MPPETAHSAGRASWKYGRDASARQAFGNRRSAGRVCLPTFPVKAVARNELLASVATDDSGCQPSSGLATTKVRRSPRRSDRQPEPWPISLLANQFRRERRDPIAAVVTRHPPAN